MKYGSSLRLWAVLQASSVLVQGVLGFDFNQRLPDCEAGKKWDHEEDMGTFWWETGAEQFAAEYINSKMDHSNWTQDLYMELFPNAFHPAMACVTVDSECTFTEKCEDFNAIGKGGLYYLFASMRNFHAFMKATKGRFHDAAFINSLKIPSIRKDLSVSEDDDKVPDALNILAGAMSFIGSAANPMAAAGLGAMSGIATLAAGSRGLDGDNTDDRWEGEVEKRLGRAVKHTYGQIDKIIASTFGKQGHHQTDIPETMRRGGTEHPAVNVFGFGRWLQDQPMKDLDKWFEMTEKLLTQAIVWQLASNMRNTVVVIRDDIKDAEGCDQSHHEWNNAAWDSKNNRCFVYMLWSGGKSPRSYFGGAEDPKKGIEDIFSKYNMDRYWTMRNAVECWEDNGGKKGDVEPNDFLNNDPTPPKCFFRSNVKKGSYKPKGVHYLYLDQDYPGQKDDRIWPVRN